MSKVNADVIAFDPHRTVRAAYDELHTLVTWWTRTRETDLGDDTGTASRELFAEARLLDDARLDQWLAGWHPGGVAWVPIDPAHHPATDQSYYLDDVRRLGERVRWMRQPIAWSQWPAATTVRAVTNIESHRRPDGELGRARSSCSTSQRGTHARVWAGRQLHVLSPNGEEWRRRIKILCIPALRGAVVHPGILL